MKIMYCKANFKCILENTDHEMYTAPGYFIHTKNDLDAREIFLAALNHEGFLDEFNSKTGMNVKVTDDVSSLDSICVIFNIENKVARGSEIYFTITDKSGNIPRINIYLSGNFNLNESYSFKVTKEEPITSVDDLLGFRVDATEMKELLASEGEEDTYLGYFFEGTFDI